MVEIPAKFFHINNNIKESATTNLYRSSFKNKIKFSLALCLFGAMVCELAGCANTADNSENKDLVNKGMSEVNSRYEESCEFGDGEGCNEFGYNYENGNGVAKDINKGNSLYEKACELGNGFGCNKLGNIYNNGEGVAKDINKANSLYEKACELGAGRGSFNLGANYTDGNGVAKDINKANSLYEKACELSDGRGVMCYLFSGRLNDEDYLIKVYGLRKIATLHEASFAKESETEARKLKEAGYLIASKYKHVVAVTTLKDGYAANATSKLIDAMNEKSVFFSLRHPEELVDINEADAVVLVEKLDVSKLKEVTSEVEMLEQYSKKILGIVYV